MYNEAVGELPEGERGGACRERDLSYANFKDWTRKGSAKVRHHTQEWPCLTFLGRRISGRNSGGTSSTDGE